MAYTLEEFQGRVLGLEDEYSRFLPKKFLEDVADQWFGAIFPVKSEMYGVDGLQRLGPTHAVAEFVGCYYRWKRMTETDMSIVHPSVKDSLLDAFGYSVIMRAMAEAEVNWPQADRTRRPHVDLETLIGFYWDDMIKVDTAACTMSLRISINMYRRTPGV